MNSERGRQIHGKAEQTREDSDFLGALKLIDEATIVYSQDQDFLGMSEIQGSRFLTLRHLYEKTGDENFLVLAKYSAQAAVEIAEKSKILEALSMPLFNLAKAQETLGDIASAVQNYQRAIDAKEANPGEFHNRVGVMADMKGHLAIAQYKSGDTSAEAKALEAANELETSDEPKYNKDVWMSGIYMKLGETMYTADPTKAIEYLKKAKQIIDANSELKLRAEQLKKVTNKLKINI